jgi:CheY-like chemotaxis protein
MSKFPIAIVIDDDTDTVEIFAEYLEIMGVDVVGRGYDGKQAAELYQQKKPDVVFLDLMMPEYDGFYALENIRKMNPDAKVVIITADLRKDTEEMLEDLKPNKIIFKPFAIDKIVDVIAEIRQAK